MRARHKCRHPGPGSSRSRPARWQLAVDAGTLAWWRVVPALTIVLLMSLVVAEDLGELAGCALLTVTLVSALT